MALSHSPKIITDNLIIHIDALNSRCYPKTGTSVIDLSGNNNNPVLQSLVTYNNSFVFPGGDVNAYSTISASSSVNSCFQDSFTLFIITKPTLFGGVLTNCGNYFGTLWSKQGINNDTNWIYTGHTCNFNGTAGVQNASTGTLNWQAYGNQSSTGFSGTNAVVSININRNETCHFTFQFIKTGSNFFLKIYKNGVLEGTSATRVYTDAPLGEVRIGGFNNNCNNNAFVGNIYLYSLYNRELSQQEINRHFNCFKGRFI